MCLFSREWKSEVVMCDESGDDSNGIDKWTALLIRKLLWDVGFRFISIVAWRLKITENEQQADHKSNKIKHSKMQRTQ